MRSFKELSRHTLFIPVLWTAIALVFIILVLCKVNLSNIGVWEERIVDRPDGYSFFSVGIPKKIRSDEYIVVTPMIKSFADNGFPVINPQIRGNGYNGLVSNFPTHHIMSYLQPLHWGYLFFGFDYGFSWYWMGLIFLHLITSFLLTRILSQGNLGVSIFGAIVITFSAPIAWWSLFPTIAHTQLIIVSAYYFLKSKLLREHVFYAVLGIFGFSGLIAGLYPAFIVPLFYLALVVIITIGIRDKDKITFPKRKLFILLGAAALFVLALGKLYVDIIDEFAVMMNTVYPGQRISTGGDTPSYYFMMFINQFKLNLRAMDYLNNSEASSFFNYSIPLLILIATTRTKKREIWPIIAYALIIYIYSFFGFPVFLAKITGFTYTTGFRAVNFAHLALMYASLLIVSEWKEREKIDLKSGIAAAVLLLGWAVVIWFFLSNTILRIDNSSAKTGTLLFFMLWSASFVFKKKKLFMISTALVIGFFGATVNPVNFGTQALTNTSIGAEIQKLSAEDPDSLWISLEEGSANYIMYANGAHSLSGVHTYPDLELWKILDPEGVGEEFYNRYAHISFVYSEGEINNYSNPYPDILQVSVSLDDLKRLGVSYVVSRLAPEAFAESGEQVVTRYGPDADSVYIYQISESD